MIKRAFATMFFCVLIGAAASTQSVQPPAVGDKTPGFELKTLADKSIRLADLTQNNPVVLIVLRGWVGYQCPLCTRQVGDFITHAKELENAGARLVLVYPGPAENLKKHARDFEAGKGIPKNFDLVIDPDLKFVNAWGLRWNVKGETAYPSTFVIDRQGVVRFEKISHGHGDRATAAEVLKALDQVSKS